MCIRDSHNLMGEVVLQAEAAVQVGRDLPAQLRHTGVGGVLGEALLQRVDARVPDVPGGDEIGLPHAQRDGILCLLYTSRCV